MLILRCDLDGRVFVAGRGATDQQRNLHVQTFHFFGDVDHFVQRRRDQSGQTDDVHVVLDGFGKDLVTGNHHAKIDHLVVVTTEYNTDDVFSDVVDVAFDGRHEDLATEALCVTAGG